VGNRKKEKRRTRCASKLGHRVGGKYGEIELRWGKRPFKALSRALRSLKIYTQKEDNGEGLNRLWREEGGPERRGGNAPLKKMLATGRFIPRKLWEPRGPHSGGEKKLMKKKNQGKGKWDMSKALKSRSQEKFDFEFCNMGKKKTRELVYDPEIKSGGVETTEGGVRNESGRKGSGKCGRLFLKDSSKAQKEKRETSNHTKRKGSCAFRRARILARNSPGKKSGPGRKDFVPAMPVSLYRNHAWGGGKGKKREVLSCRRKCLESQGGNGQFFGRSKTN